MPHNNFNVLIKRHQCLHQPFERIFCNLQCLRYLGLRHTRDAGGFGLVAAVLGDQLVELDRKTGLCRQLLNILEAEIRQHVVGT